MVVDSILFHAELGPNNHRVNAPHFKHSSLIFNSDKGFSSFLKKSKPAENVQDTADHAELEQMAQKRFTILESRDAELRDLLANVRDGAQVGICYDLCPEKERYRRIVQSDIAGFEKENGKVNLGTEL